MESFAHDVRDSTDGALNACLEVLYGRDPQVLAHVRRVARGSLMIATAMKIGEPLLGEIWRAALLHDIGEPSMSAGIMAKDGPLRSDDQAAMRLPAEIVGVLREHFDGSGTPHGLRGGAIPIGARIVAVAEAFDMLAGDPAVANGELVRGAGKRFDPEVVNAWLYALDQAERDDSTDAGEWRMRCS